MTRPTWIEVDLDAVRRNVAAIASHVAPAEVCAVVKADGYGHGDAPVAQAALDGGATALAVALVEEGVRLREAGIGAPILLLSEPPVSSITLINRWALTPTVYSQRFVEELEASREEPCSVHLKVDTGMHRVGAQPEEALKLAKLIDRSELLELGGVWTHFSSAESDADFTSLQLQRFEGVVAKLDAEEIDSGLLHASNSAGALMRSDARLDMVRVGISIYGLKPGSDFSQLQLQPAMSLLSKVSHVTRFSAGERLSYGRKLPLETDSWVATVPIGYADGFSREMGDKACVLINGEFCPIAGVVTMDQIVVVTPNKPQIGDSVVLLGQMNEKEISADDWAEWIGTINYEVVCGMGPRLPRRFLNKGKTPSE